jgi:hypothetical protein
MGLRPTIDSGRHPTLLAELGLLFLVELFALLTPLLFLL